LLRPILNGKADVVYGSLFRGSEAHRVLYFWHYVGNQFLTLLSNMMSNLNLTDMETGFKAFKREVLQQLTLQEDRFGFEPEITAKVELPSTKSPFPTAGAPMRKARRSTGVTDSVRSAASLNTISERQNK
jgi:hypothetical protein